ncbi:MAG TPA: alpha-1,2-fucosyltransferase [Methylomirabilota bacterium]|nr:alpha-1,2-fucosyltransferase [Methylomirabilota bacterium]
MIITRLTGGLGNQLFQYGMARRLAEQHHAEVLLDTSGYGPNGEFRPNGLTAFNRPVALFRFRIKARMALPNEIARLRDDFYRAATRDRIVRQIRRAWPRFLWNGSHIVERQYRFQPEALGWPDDVYLQGYWQSPKYFEDIAPLIRQELEATEPLVVEAANETVARLKARFSSVVSLHVRRGDLAHAHETLRKKNITCGAPVTIQYIARAIDQFDSETCFFVFSDSPKDIAWCRENIRAKNLEFSTAESDLWDFTAMALCDHHIIANSTFSWWAAWLNPRTDKRVIAPQVWSTPQSRVQMPTDDLLPETWIKL